MARKTLLLTLIRGAIPLSSGADLFACHYASYTLASPVEKPVYVAQSSASLYMRTIHYIREHVARGMADQQAGWRTDARGLLSCAGEERVR